MQKINFKDLSPHRSWAAMLHSQALYFEVPVVSGMYYCTTTVWMGLIGGTEAEVTLTTMLTGIRKGRQSFLIMLPPSL